ncbi:hypothetical protein SB49_08460 [Sediminicola sp. YIK13]|uniref:DUF885 domain-containing protein n=1 Tax=Sediminicola sp. YIK13 TaxID=1453352 RepID=UPI0007228DC0|nr:DUF885 domain-containing protein [Sediminicola sp. YIK13]ALM07823.1 hypothetical protein SB49_08460 [Sediminicola sp. YIK13]
MKLISSILIILLTVFIGCKEQKPAPARDDSASLDSLFQEYYHFKQRINPIEASKGGESKYNDHIANYISDPYQKELKTNYGQFLEASKEYDSTMVSPAQWMSLKVLQWDCNIKLEGLNNNLVTIASPIYDMPSFELMPLAQISSLQLYVAQLATGKSVQPFHTVKDYENWLKRVDDYLVFLDTCIVKMKVGMSRAVVLPKVLTEKMVPQLNAFITDPVEDHLFFTPITAMPKDFSQEDRERLSIAYSKMITDKLKPKYKDLQQFLIQQYLPSCRESSGLGALPNGPETYNYLIKYHTTTNMTVDEIHELGKSEVTRILIEMEKAKTKIGFKGDIKSFFEHIRTRKDQMPFTEASQVIDNFNSIKDRMGLKLKDVFDISPRADFEVRRTEAFREASASAEYVPGTKDGSRAGIFYVPIPDVTSYNKYADEALFLHEAIPGHHYQLSLQQENTNLPEFLHPESMGVFVEGWALYAESLGKELGLYEDPIQYFGMLSMEMHRAIRLVVDTGIHGKGWTREQAIQYSLENEAESEVAVISEIERYMATPGQALSYKIGQLKIRELRTRAESALGEAFSIQEFHNQVLNSGSLPLVLLEEKIEAWIKNGGKKS